MYELEVFAGDRILVALSEEPHLVGIFQFLNACWIAAEFLVVLPDGAGITHGAVNHLFFAIAPDLVHDLRQHGESGYRQKRDEQHERNQDVAARTHMQPAGFKISKFRTRSHSAVDPISLASAEYSAGYCSAHPQCPPRRERCAEHGSGG